MHELSIAESILDITTKKVPDRSLSIIVHVTLGPLSGVSSDPLEFGFSQLAKQSGYASARLAIHPVKATCHCIPCGSTYEVEQFDTLCPQCGGLERTVLSGTELQLTEIEIADSESSN